MTASDALLAHRIEAKMTETKVNSIINRVHIAQPEARDDVDRLPLIPKSKKGRNTKIPTGRNLETGRKGRGGSAGVFNINMKGTFRA